MNPKRLPVTSEATDVPQVERIKGVVILQSGKHERNARLELHEDGTVVLGNLVDPSRSITFTPDERYSPADWMRRLMTNWPES